MCPPKKRNCQNIEILFFLLQWAVEMPQWKKPQERTYDFEVNCNFKFKFCNLLSQDFFCKNLSDEKYMTNKRDLVALNISPIKSLKKTDTCKNNTNHQLQLIAWLSRWGSAILYQEWFDVKFSKV